MQDGLDHSRARLGEQRQRERQQRLSVLGGLRRCLQRGQRRSSRRSGRWRRWPRRRWRPAPPISTSGKRKASSPPSIAEASAALRRGTCSVSASMPPTACLTPTMLSVCGELEQRSRLPRPRAGAVWDVVDDQRNRGALRRLPGSAATIAASERPHVVRHDRQRRPHGRARRRAPRGGRSSRVCCTSRRRRRGRRRGRRRRARRWKWLRSRSSSSRDDASAVVATATIPAAPPARISSAWRSRASASTRRSSSNGVITGTSSRSGRNDVVIARSVRRRSAPELDDQEPMAEVELWQRSDHGPAAQSNSRAPRALTRARD